MLVKAVSGTIDKLKVHMPNQDTFRLLIWIKWGFTAINKFEVEKKILGASFLVSV